jgi:hypothetical protein
MSVVSPGGGGLAAGGPSLPEMRYGKGWLRLHDEQELQMAAAGVVFVTCPRPADPANPGAPHLGWSRAAELIVW